MRTDGSVMMLARCRGCGLIKDQQSISSVPPGGAQDAAPLAPRAAQQPPREGLLRAQRHRHRVRAAAQPHCN